MTSPALCVGIFAGAQPGIFQDSYSVSPPLILGGILPLHTTFLMSILFNVLFDAYR